MLKQQIPQVFTLSRTNPDMNDLNYIVDYSSYNAIQNWDWMNHCIGLVLPFTVRFRAGRIICVVM